MRKLYSMAIKIGSWWWKRRKFALKQIGSEHTNKAAKATCNSVRWNSFSSSASAILYVSSLFHVEIEFYALLMSMSTNESVVVCTFHIEQGTLTSNQVKLFTIISFINPRISHFSSSSTSNTNTTFPAEEIEIFQNSMLSMMCADCNWRCQNHQCWSLCRQVFNKLSALLHVVLTQLSQNDILGFPADLSQSFLGNQTSRMCFHFHAPAVVWIHEK